MKVLHVLLSKSKLPRVKETSLFGSELSIFGNTNETTMESRSPGIKEFATISITKPLHFEERTHMKPYTLILWFEDHFAQPKTSMANEEWESGGSGTREPTPPPRVERWKTLVGSRFYIHPHGNVVHVSMQDSSPGECNNT